MRVMRMKLFALASVVVACAACPPASLIGQPCQKAGDEPCEGDALLRCDGRFYVELAPCASQCIVAAKKADVTHAGATVDTDETWTCAEGPHLVPAGLTVSAGVTLTIEAGAIVKLQSAAKIDTDPAGRVVSVGDANAPILFTSADGKKSGFGNGSSGGLNVFAVDSGDPSDIEHTIIERGIHGLGVLGISPTKTLPIVKDNTLRDITRFGILVSCDDATTPIPDFAADGNQFFGDGADVSACNQTELPAP